VTHPLTGPVPQVVDRLAGSRGVANGIPGTGVAAIVMNVTITQPSLAGCVSVTPSGGNTTSTVNFGPGQDIPNLAVVPVGPDGAVHTYNSAGTTHVLFDALGWFS